jgi:hypothetical protein
VPRPRGLPRYLVRRAPRRKPRAAPATATRGRRTGDLTAATRDRPPFRTAIGTGRAHPLRSRHGSDPDPSRRARDAIRTHNGHSPSHELKAVSASLSTRKPGDQCRGVRGRRAPRRRRRTRLRPTKDSARTRAHNLAANGRPRGNAMSRAGRARRPACRAPRRPAPPPGTGSAPTWRAGTVSYEPCTWQVAAIECGRSGRRPDGFGVRHPGGTPALRAVALPVCVNRAEAKWLAIGVVPRQRHDWGRERVYQFTKCESPPRHRSARAAGRGIDQPRSRRTLHPAYCCKSAHGRKVSRPGPRPPRAGEAESTDLPGKGFPALSPTPIEIGVTDPVNHD